ncbi:RNA polymerase sigma factor [Bacillus sp. CGMCC 1.16607]|uniref:RNA polymerase sigma factor n=1 Tax=Bacillus sp. CGMCC 1.16607 TaxID=3351842 RepID=UPI00362D5860
MNSAKKVQLGLEIYFMSKDNLNILSDDLRNIEREFKQMIEPYRSELWNYCFKLTRSPWDAEDLVQDTLLKSLSVLAKIFQPINTRAYLFKIATNLWIDQLRKHKYLNVPLEDYILDDKATTNEFLLLEHLDFLVRNLPPTQYVALILSDVLQFKGSEVAEILTTSEGAVYTNLSRARSKMRHNLKLELFRKEKRALKNLAANTTIDLLLKGFREKNPELIASVLNENVITDITHSGLEMGKNETEKNSLRDWAEIVQNQHIIVSEYVELWGRPVIVELEEKQDNKLYLNNIHYFELFEGKVSYWKFYCFSWDLMTLAAKELNVDMNAKYFYHIF